MNEIKAQLNNYRQSPRKFRLVADAIRGKSVVEAKHRLTLITKRAVSPLGKLLNSAIANAKNLGADEKSLFVKAIAVNQGSILYRRRPAAHGSAHPIHKRTSHVKIVLAEKVAKVSNKKAKAK